MSTDCASVLIFVLNLACEFSCKDLINEVALFSHVLEYKQIYAFFVQFLGFENALVLFF